MPQSRSFRADKESATSSSSLSHRPIVREVRRKVPHLRLVRALFLSHVVRFLWLTHCLRLGCWVRYVRPATLVRTCDDCNFGTYGGRCIICGSQGSSFCFFAPASVSG